MANLDVDLVTGQAVVLASVGNLEADRVTAQAVVLAGVGNLEVDLVTAQVVVLSTWTLGGVIGPEPEQGDRYQGRRFQGGKGAYQGEW